MAAVIVVIVVVAKVLIGDARGVVLAELVDIGVRAGVVIDKLIGVENITVRA